jgi:hypothetical protein
MGISPSLATKQVQDDLHLNASVASGLVQNRDVPTGPGISNPLGCSIDLEGRTMTDWKQIFRVNDE